MGVNNRGYRALSRLLRSRSGTAEIVGTVMFLVILLLFFSNVFLWHDQATRDMDAVILDRVNSHVSIEILSMNESGGVVEVANNGGVGFSLSRLWIIEKNNTEQNHNYTDFNKTIPISTRWLSGGSTINVTLLAGSPMYEAVVMDDEIWVYYTPPEVDEVTFKILTDLGNTAAVKYYG